LCFLHEIWALIPHTGRALHLCGGRYQEKISPDGRRRALAGDAPAHRCGQAAAVPAAKEGEGAILPGKAGKPGKSTPPADVKH